MPARIADPRPLNVPSSLDPSSVFIAKSLFAPLLSVAVLLLCLAGAGERFGGSCFLLSVMVFLTTAGIIEATGLSPGPLSLQALVSLCLRWLLVLSFLWALIYLSGLETRFAVRPLMVWAVVMPWALWVGQWWIGHFMTRAADRAGPRRGAVIVGLTELGLRLEKVLNSNVLLHTQVLGFFEDRSRDSPPDRLPPAGVNRIIGRLSDLRGFVGRNNVQQVYITLPMSRQLRILAIYESLRDSTASVYFVPDLFIFDLIQPRFDVIDGVPVVAVCESPFVGARSFFKRMFDLLVSGVLILLLSPVLLFVAVGVRLSSPGPVLFRQRRYGLDGAEIHMYKFRSMTVMEDGAKVYQQTTRNDARLTRFGAWIRKVSLDELPQLFNVFLGSMSLVGPRPHVVAVNEQYRRLIPGYMIRHKVKPGITGWAQVNGARGGDDLEAMRRRIEYDLDYLRNWSLALDFSILVRTVAVVFNDRHAF
ncbi:MAG: undecaprenyl-phosphate glucose phosphotransferase [Steroidobacteraceae bacterium]